MRMIAATAAAIAVLASSQAGASDWKPMAVPAWSALGMVDTVDQVVQGQSITTWFRFVDAPGRPPAEDDPEVVDAMRDGGHVDLRATLDCAAKRFRVEGTRIVDREDKVLDVGFVPDADRFWIPLGRRTRASAAYAALCPVRTAAR